MENKAIEDGFRNLKDGEKFEDLYKSASARAIADWLVGMNLSRLYSCIYKETYSVGRVQTPTLYLIAKRDSEINLFKKQKYYTVDLSYGGLKLVSDRIDKIEVAEQLLNLLEDEIVITEVEDKEISTKPDKPYDLTTLQREANKYFGYSANDTLNLAQGLYEKKLITYPRTDSRYLTEDMVNTIFNSSKVTDHYAIIPTISGIGKAKDLSDKESKIYNLIKNKLLASCSDNLKESSRKIRYEYDKFNFNASGKTVIDEGYTKYLKIYGKQRQENELPDVKTGDNIKLTSKNISEKFTKAPSHYNEDTLLKAMESAGVESLDKDIEVEYPRLNSSSTHSSLDELDWGRPRKGLGTPAIRAGIIENLIHKDLIRRDKKNLLVTEKGNRLVSIVEDKFKSAETTSEWEMKLAKISSGEVDKEDFLREIEVSIRELVDRYKNNLNE